MRIVEPSVELISITPFAERVIETMGRLCWKSEDKISDGSAAPFIQMIKGKNHASVLEHASASFIIGTDRGITHEIVRHRLASYSQTSTRYCNYAKDKFGSEITVVRPSQLKPAAGDIATCEDDIAYFAWVASCTEAESAYLCMLKRGCSPQVARSVLPTCTYSEIGMTANFREWIHFIKLRTSPAAHPDMQVVAKMVKETLVTLAPSVFGDL